MSYDPSAYPPFAVTVDIVVFAVTDQLRVLLVERGVEPFAGTLALPGGFVHMSESVEDAAHRELREETGLTARMMPSVHLEQLETFGAVNRDPRMRVVSVAYLGLSRSMPIPEPGTDAAAANWVPVSEALSSPLAFDHKTILTTGLERARAKLEYTTLATRLAGEEFTLGELHHVYEVIWDTKVDLANFRRKVLGTAGFVVATSNKRVGAAGGAPATIYRPGPGAFLSPPLARSSG